MTRGSDLPRTRIVRALEAAPGTRLRVQGWVRTVRRGKEVAFFEVNDGSCLANLQVVAGAGEPGFDEARDLSTGTAVDVVGTLVESPAKGQKVELRPESIEIVGRAAPDYPLQKKRHSFEFLRTIAHLRVRTNTFGAVFRVRNALAYGTHRFFQERGFVYVHTPIITSSDTEGAGELFRVTTFDLANVPTKDGAVDDAADFFGRAAYLTVSGQLCAEAMAIGLSDVYTFGPTFRAENSNTSRHASEFWMIEPEMAFCDLAGDCDLAEAYVKFLIGEVFDRCAEDMAFFDKRIAPGIVERLEHVASSSFERMSYADAVAALERSGETFEYPVGFGLALQAEHERWLTEKHVGRPVFVTDWPKEIKAFYMRRNDDGRTVAAMDLLVPGVGELIGGSQREERADVLEAAITEAGLDPEAYAWYVDLRRYGTVPHSGFGLGFERLVMYVTGMTNIRDVIPFPRTPRHCAY
ncbi:MAG: asparagine--tRNA ligase [Deltaproteobacteria bacterium]|nr:MAG: asparagine--tRNA ligase [Deltaproteobacteria bacterium]